MLLNGTLDSLKVFSMYLGGNRRWVPLITVYWKAHQYSGICKLLECLIRYQYSVILKYRYVLFRQIWFGIGTPFKIAFTFYFIAGESELLIKKKNTLSHFFNEAFLSPLSDNSKLQLCFSWRVICTSVTINVTCLTETLKWKKKA